MNTAPQQVTERYVSNLISNGRNKEFDITTIAIRDAYASGISNEHIGYYFTATINGSPGTTQCGAGATISQAVRRALEKHGVTFR